jgi:hypothetical protein
MQKSPETDRTGVEFVVSDTSRRSRSKKGDMWAASSQPNWLAGQARVLLKVLIKAAWRSSAKTLRSWKPAESA